MLFRNQGGVRYQVPINHQHQNNSINFAYRTSNSDGYPRPNVQTVSPNLIYSQSPAQVKYVHTDYGKQESHVQNVQTKTDKGQGSPKQTQQIKKTGLSNGKKILIGFLALLLITGGVVGTIFYLNHRQKQTTLSKVESSNENLEDGSQESSQTLLQKAQQSVKKDISQILAKTDKSSIKTVAPATSVSSTQSGQNLKGAEAIVSQSAKTLQGQLNKQLSVVQGLNPSNSQVITYTKTPTTSVQTPTTKVESNSISTPSTKTQLSTSQYLIKPTVVDAIEVSSVPTGKTHVSLN